MAVISTRWTSQLDDGFVLSPERYDPRTRQNASASTEGRTISELVDLSRETLQTQKTVAGLRYVVLDTGDAKNGIISLKVADDHTGVRSAKKVLKSGDVIISRLRPYLRQAGFVDEGLARLGIVTASTEFYVLRSKDGKSIAYLVAFLLSDKVQQILAASQEGGHHPRVPEKTLMGLVVPAAIVGERDRLSQAVEDATLATRRAEGLLTDAGRLVAELLNPSVAKESAQTAGAD
jgi:hypothetical protein